MIDGIGAIREIQSGDAVYFDSINGVAGTISPIGTAAQPVNNWDDFKVIAAARKTPTIKLVHGVITLTGETKSALPDVTTDQLAYTLVQEVILTANHPALDVAFDLMTDGGGATAYGQIWVNDVAVGTEQTDITGAFVTFREQILGPFMAGDRIQIYAHTDNALQLAHVQNFIVTETIIGYRFIGNGFSDPHNDDVENWIDLAGFTLTECSFEYINIDFNGMGILYRCGHFEGCGWIRPLIIISCDDFFDCDQIVPTTLTDCDSFFNCGFIVPTTMVRCTFFYNCSYIESTMNDCTYFYNCSEANFSYDCTRLTTNPIMSFRTGIITIINLTTANTFTITGDGLRLLIDASCKLGTIDYYGKVRITDNTIGISGTHTQANDPVVMTDAAATFVVDSLIGLTIRNTTDGSHGVITDNTATSITVAILLGGINNIWTTGDAYTVDYTTTINNYTGRGAVKVGTFTLLAGVAEQDCLVFPAAKQEIDIELFMTNLVQTNTVREYVDDLTVAPQQITAKLFPTVFDAGTTVVALHFVQKNAAYKITLKATITEGVDKNIPYRIILRDLS